MNKAIDTDIQGLQHDIRQNIRFSMGRDPDGMDRYACFIGLAMSVKQRLMEQWIQTRQSCRETFSKHVFYLSVEFLPGRFLKNYLLALGLEETARNAVAGFGFDLDDLEEEEWDAGLGNGGLGRLASCYLDSAALLRLPVFGYGIYYNFGIFYQVIENGFQKEKSDNWMRRRNPWEIMRHEIIYKVRFNGRSEAYSDALGNRRFRWVDTRDVMAMACDIMVPGFDNGFVSHMRLWTATSSREFDLEFFNRGDYQGAVEAKVQSESISKVLYPSDEMDQGKALRLKQQYFFVSATLQDIIRLYLEDHLTFNEFPDWAAIQLNDTHPAIAIPELMRLLMDEHGLDWEQGWNICEKTFAYTNHTILPEALETWPLPLMQTLLPRLLDIIYEINHRFLDYLKTHHPENTALLRDLSIFDESGGKQIRMAHLAIIGSHAVNGVARMHSDILANGLFAHFNRIFPGRLTNVTNGITPRRWLLQSNPELARLISSAIGTTWVTDLSRLEQLAPFADDPEFRTRWENIKQMNKQRLARYALRKVGMGINPGFLFDVQAKRIHEYKRQLLNILHVIFLYNRLRLGRGGDNFVPQCFFFSGKAAPAYHTAKLIIKLINSVSRTIQNDPAARELLNVVFLPNYCISQAEKLVPAADVSEQISTAGYEASGTGNMKFALNGAITIGTLDGANVEILEAVGRDNICIFGLEAEQVNTIRGQNYSPAGFYRDNPELKAVIDMVHDGFFSPEDPHLFKPLVANLLEKGDYYMVLADFNAYAAAHQSVTDCYRHRELWTRMSILNTAHMGRFSSDRAVLEYARNIWQATPLTA